MNLEVSIYDFLAAFYPDENETVCLRLFKAKDEPLGEHNKPIKLAVTRAALISDARLQASLNEANRTRGVYFLPNAGGDKDADITRFNAFFVECDTRSIEEQHAAYDACPLAPSLRLVTRKSVHAYWLRAGDCSEAAWRDVQARLISYFDGDQKNKNRRAVCAYRSLIICTSHRKPER